MTSEQVELPAAPAENLAGVAEARHQMWKINQPGWTLKYDRERDTLYLRAPERRPAITYFDPEAPEMEFRLDIASGDLVGVDLVNCQAVIAKKIPVFRRILRVIIWTQRLGKIPGLHAALRVVARGLRGRVSDELQLRVRPA